MRRGTTGNRAKAKRKGRMMSFEYLSLFRADPSDNVTEERRGVANRDFVVSERRRRPTEQPEEEDSAKGGQGTESRRRQFSARLDARILLKRRNV